MSTENAYRALEEVAKREGISVEEVIFNIEMAITEALNTIQAENDQNMLEKWKAIPCAGDVPTALELLDYLGSKLSERIKEDEKTTLLS